MASCWRVPSAQPGGAAAYVSHESTAPVISIIIPCYNQGRFLGCAIESVLRQTYTWWEAMVVDDGSTDDTSLVAQAFADTRMRYVRQNNQGLCAARNAGVAAASGKYLAFLDADDAYEEAFLETCLRVLESRADAVAAYTACRYMDVAGTALEAGSGIVAEEAFRDRLVEGGFFPPCAVLIRADVARASGLFDVRLTSVEDWDLWLRASERGTFVGIASPLVRYRITPGSMSTDVARMHRNRTLVLAKRYGPHEGDPVQWPDAKRHAYGFAFRSSAVQYLAQGQEDMALDLLSQAVRCWPPLLGRLDTFYELACGDQDRSIRGQAALMDIRGNGIRMLAWLDGLFTEPPAELMSYRRRAYGNAHLALAMLYDQAGDWGAARRHLSSAVIHDTRLLGSRSVLRRAVKLLCGRRTVAFGKALLRMC